MMGFLLSALAIFLEYGGKWLKIKEGGIEKEKIDIFVPVIVASATTSLAITVRNGLILLVVVCILWF